MNPVVLVSAAIAVREGKVLLTRRREGDRFAGQWEFPGGKVDPGESPPAALVRELQEEIGTGAEILSPYQFAYHEYDRTAGDSRGPLRVLLLFYLVRLEGEPRAVEVAEVKWTPIKELPSLEILKGSLSIVERLVTDHSNGVV
ncbi:MAG: (deoxy)nucleoside triphosphate pyrophosphohydrolase [Bdellovibrionota bacterium]